MESADRSPRTTGREKFTGVHFVDYLIKKNIRIEAIKLYLGFLNFYLSYKNEKLAEWQKNILFFKTTFEKQK